LTPGVTIWRCLNCRAGFFPERLLCPRCHGAGFARERVYEGVVEEVSVVRHMLGQENWQPRRIANVCTTDGQRVTVGLREELEPGAVVELFEEELAPFARARPLPAV
jgi:uncharacterized OB-fold protein